MLDANGRRVEVGDVIASPNLHVDGGRATEGAILGEVQEIAAEVAYLGDGLSFESHEFITLGGYQWHICLGCNTPSPVDVRTTGDVPVCPFCESEEMEPGVSTGPETVAQLALL